MTVTRSRFAQIVVLLAAATIVAALPPTSFTNAAAPATQATAALDDAWFNEHVLPVLAKNCFECHSHATGKMKGGLALDWRSGWERGGDSGPAVVPHSPERSLLIKAIRRGDENLQMPPKKALGEADVATLEEWVQRGAPDPRVNRPAVASSKKAEDWWSLRPLNRPAVPVIDGVIHPVDRFLRAKLAEKGLAPSPQADRRTLIRRLTFDLHGLPPTPEEVDAFVKDDSPDAYERLVDRLLASPRYGERWARHWFDVIHFAHTHGFEHDVFRENAWRYRDYAIAAFNADTPWPRFIREQLAADVFYPAEPKLTAALGFLGAGPLDLSAAGTAPKMFEYQDRDDLVTQVITAFTSTTINCARCHDHKFDPISQEDYYALQAVFAGVGKGDVDYDEDPAIAKQRARWTALAAAARAPEANVAPLLSAENAALVAEWEREQTAAAQWRPLDVQEWRTSDDSVLRWMPDGSLLAVGPRPERDTYTLTIPGPLSLSAIRLDVLSDPSLFKNGPGRQENGNLHLSEFQVQVAAAHNTSPKPVKIRRAVADWNQEGWSIEKSLDGNEKTAWGIYPKVGQSHAAVFELDGKISVAADEKLVIVLKQLHGGGHLIGRFKLSASADASSAALLLPSEVSDAVQARPDQRSQPQRLAVAAFALRLRAEKELAALPATLKVFAAAAGIAKDGGPPVPKRGEPKVVHVLDRGDVNKPAAVASPGTLSCVSALNSRFMIADATNESARRAALADWLADPKNPLTWRSIANRTWQDHFGRGICDTPGDLGRMGGVPSHPELLDWLACELRDNGGSLKKLHRLIVTSAAYQQISDRRADADKCDADNRLLWRMNRNRIDAESYRDAVLSVSGRLDLTMGGPGVQQFKLGKSKIQLTPTLDYVAFNWDSPGACRRSIYRVVWRGIQDPFMEALDFPDAGLPAPTRAFSASPLQALALLNNDFVLRQAEHLAKRIEQAGDSPERQIAAAFRFTLQRDPTPQERARFEAYAKKYGLSATCRLLLNCNEFLFVD